MIMMIFSGITDKQCIKDRYYHSKAKILPVMHSDLEMVEDCQDRISVSIIYYCNRKWHTQHFTAI